MSLKRFRSQPTRSLRKVKSELGPRSDLRRLKNRLLATKGSNNNPLTGLICIKDRAGHFRYFLTFSIIKNDFLHFLIKLI